MAKTGLKATIDVTGIPEALAAMRRELAGLLRAEAVQVVRDEGETVVAWAVAKALRRTAGAFEAGLSRADAEEADGAR